MAISQENSKPRLEEVEALHGGQAAASEDAWDEERIEKGLKILKEMHIQLRGLRTTIPRLLEPLARKQPSPETLFKEFSISTTTANQEIQQFRKLMNEEESSRLLEHCKKSRAGNPQAIKPWRVTDHPDWLTRDS